MGYRFDPFGIGNIFSFFTPGALRDPGLIALKPSGFTTCVSAPPARNYGGMRWSPGLAGNSA